ncbi:MAG: M20/M25/M40 family metallo-hydrolase [Sulfolobaceae archaeon]|nr:M20/M25/M40 family metallo-hydrolase [Sulfolobaceae archaeon]
MDREKEELKYLIELVEHPSISATGEGIRDTAEYLKELLNSLGITARIFETKGHPIVYGEVGKGNKTLLIYNHYDVQPPDPLSEWTSPPFKATIRNGRLYGRGASDNKGTLMARLMAVKRLLDEGKLNIKLKFVYEGEEEIGSIHLEDFARENKELLKADSVIMEGSGLDIKGRPLIVLGVKGILYVQLEVVTAARDIHSSNAPIVYNPVWELIRALNSIYDGERVLLEGFYDDIRPLTDEEKKLLYSIDVELDKVKESLGVKELKVKDRIDYLEKLYTSPTCNIDGIYSGYIGEGSKTIVPYKAFVKIDFRLVPDQDPYKIFESLKKRLNEIGFKGEVKMLDRGEYPVRTSPSSPIVKAVTESATEVYNKEPVIIINSPGTQPMDVFVKIVGIKDAVSAIGPGDPYSRAHAPDESIDINNYYKAIEHTYKFILRYQET